MSTQPEVPTEQDDRWMDERTFRVAKALRRLDPETAELLLLALRPRPEPGLTPGSEEWRRAIGATAGSTPKEDVEELIRIAREAHDQEKRGWK